MTAPEPVPGRDSTEQAINLNGDTSGSSEVEQGSPPNPAPATPTRNVTAEPGDEMVTDELVLKAIAAGFAASGSNVARVFRPVIMRAALAAVLPDVEERVRRECAEEHIRDLEHLRDHYPADVFPANSTSQDAIAGTALRVVLTTNIEHWRTSWAAEPDGATPR